jgi:glycosyltransferase involved in cell wall biosynthesis
VYNGEAYVAGAIESLIAQTYPHWQMTIYDNCSTDDTGSICRGLAERDARIRYVRQPQNIGLARNFNAAFRPVRTEYFKWMAHDDLSAPDMLEKCLAALQSHPDAVMAYPAAIAIDGDGHELPGYDLGAEPDLTSAVASERFRAYTALQRPSVARYMFALMRTDAVRKTRLMRSHMWADATLLSELVLQGTFVPVNETSNLLRVFPGHASALMGKGELRAWQQVLDPRLAGRLGTVVSRYRRYEEYFVSVARSDLPIMDKASLLLFCATLPVRRLPDVVAREWRSVTA